MRADPRSASPRFARRVLSAVAPRREARVIEGELQEDFLLRVGRDGEASARRWYRRQVWGFVWRWAVVRRVTEDEGEEGGMMMESLGIDLRWALRSLRKRPGFTAVAVATLALGIGANSAIFTLVNAHFFESLPYRAPDDLVLLWETGQGNLEITTVSPGSYWTWRDEATSFVDVAAYNVDFATLSGDGVAERVSSSVVSPHFFDLLGV
jgi:hypothetical protein